MCRMTSVVLIIHFLEVSLWESTQKLRKLKLVCGRPITFLCAVWGWVKENSSICGSFCVGVVPHLNWTHVVCKTAAAAHRKMWKIVESNCSLIDVGQLLLQRFCNFNNNGFSCVSLDFVWLSVWESSKNWQQLEEEPGKISPAYSPVSSSSFQYMHFCIHL